MYRMKRAGPKTDHCGTPDVTGTLSEEVPSRTTAWDLLLRKTPLHCEHVNSVGPGGYRLAYCGLLHQMP